MNIFKIVSKLLISIALILMLASSVAEADLTREDLLSAFITRKENILNCIGNNLCSPSGIYVKSGWKQADDDSNSVKIHLHIEITAEGTWLFNFRPKSEMRNTCISLIKTYIEDVIEIASEYFTIRLSAVDNFFAVIHYPGESKFEYAAIYENGQIFWHNVCGEGEEKLEFDEDVINIASQKYKPYFPPTERYLVYDIEGPEKLYLVNEDTLKIGMVGIEIPSGNEAAQNQIKDYLDEELLFQVVHLQYDSTLTDDEEKSLAYIYILESDIWISEELISLGLAKVTRQYTFERQERYLFLESEAQKKRIGIWK